MEEPVVQSKKPKELTMPVAVLLSAVVIAIAIIVVKMPRAPQTTGTTTTAEQNAAYGDMILATKGKITVPPVTASDHIRGATDAKLTIVEYSDLECPYCQRFHATMQQVMAKYGDKVRWVYRHYPLDCVDNTDSECTPLHPKARSEAIASECAAAQGGNEAFWKFTDEIFAITPANNRLDPAELTKAAKKLGLDTAAFDTCVTNKTYADVVSKDAKGGVTIGVGGTPLSIIIDKDGNTYKVEGAYPYEAMAKVIEKLTK